VRFGVFFELQLPRPWHEGDEEQLVAEALEQAELADRLGFHCLWATEHHFLEEYSHSSAPEVFLAAVAARTERIRIGHGIRLMPPAYNHPARVAEMLATLDLVSRGRVEWGIGSSSSATEILGFGFDPHDKEPMQDEAAREVAKMLSTTPYPGHEGTYFSMPARNVVPKPVQRPHPPMWTACSKRQTIARAAELGVGALTFSFVSPLEAEEWVRDYYAIFEERCTPLGRAVNPRVAMVTGFGCADDADAARERFKAGLDFFGFGLDYYYGSGRHVPGVSNLWSTFETNYQPGDEGWGDLTPFSDPDGLRRRYRVYEDAGVDQVILMPQAGRNRHDDICTALELSGRHVLPDFAERDEAAQAARAERLAPAVERAMARVERVEPPADLEPIEAFGLRSRKAKDQTATFFKQ